KLKSDIELAHNNSNEALRIISDAIMLTDASFVNSKNRERAKYYLARGQLLIKSNQEAAAITDFNQSLNLLKKDSSSNYVSDYTYTHALHGLAQSYINTNVDSSIYYYKKTIENDYQTQQLIVSKLSNFKNSQWNRSVLKEYLKVLWTAYNQREAII